MTGTDTLAHAIEVIRDRFRALKECFQGAQAPAADDDTSDSLQEQGGKPKRKRASGEGYPTNDWLVDKADAGIRVTESFGTGHSAKEILQDCLGLYREIRAAFQLSPEGYPQGCQTQLSSVGTALEDLCLDLDAIEASCTPRLGLRQIAIAGPRIKSAFVDVSGVLKQWSKHFDISRLLQICSDLISLVETDVQTQAKKADSESSEPAKDALIDLANEALKHHDASALRRDREKLREELAAIGDKYREAMDELHRLECLGHVEPPFVTEVRLALERAGLWVATAMRGLNMICIPEIDWIERIRLDWIAIERSAEGLQREFTRYAKSQIHMPADFCTETTTRMLGHASEALEHLATLRGGAATGALSRVCELVDSIDGDLTRLSSQVEKLEGFRKDVLYEFWWPIVRIRLACACEPTEEPCCEELAGTLFKALDDLKKKAVAGCPEPRAGRFAMKPLVYAAPREHAGPVTGLATVFEETDQLVAELAKLSPASLQPRIKEVSAQSQAEAAWLKDEPVVGKASTQESKLRVGGRWSAIHASLTTFAAVASSRPKVSDEVKRQIAQIEARLSRQDRLLREALGATRR